MNSPARVLVSLFLLLGVSYAQAPDDGTKLREEARQPRFYQIALDKPVEVQERSLATDMDGETWTVLEVRGLKFHFDDKDNRLTAVATIATVSAIDAIIIGSSISKLLVAPLETIIGIPYFLAIWTSSLNTLRALSNSFSLDFKRSTK